MSKGIYSDLIKSEMDFDLNNVFVNLKIVKKTTSERKRSQRMLTLYLSMSRIILKNINNFFFLVRHIPPGKLVHTREDIAIEMYIIMNTCVGAADLKNINGFPYYYNKACLRAMQRLKDRNYKKHQDVVFDNETVNDALSKKSVKFYSDVAVEDLISNFDEVSQKIIYSKMKYEKPAEFVLANSISQAVYSSKLKDVRETLKIQFRDEHRFTTTTSH